MASKPEDVQVGPSLDDVIRRDVLKKVGKVANLLKIDIKPISGSQYRVNVYVKGDPSEAGVIVTSRIETSFVHTAVPTK
jgi:hypothetical protein